MARCGAHSDRAPQNGFHRKYHTSRHCTPCTCDSHDQVPDHASQAMQTYAGTYQPCCIQFACMQVSLDRHIQTDALSRNIHTLSALSHPMKKHRLSDYSIGAWMRNQTAAALCLPYCLLQAYSPCGLFCRFAALPACRLSLPDTTTASVPGGRRKHRCGS